jgi:transposase
MESTELYRRILGLEAPWRVVEVELDVQGNRVRVRVADDGSARRCPECGKSCPGYDHTERSWRHLDTCQMETVLTASVPRVECPQHGVRTVAVPWAEPGARFTALFEAMVIEWLKAASIKEVSERLRLGWGQADGIMQRAVERGLARRETVAPERIGVDETSFQKRHEYVTVVTDLDESRVLYVGDDRKAQTLAEWYGTLSPEVLKQLRVVAMDMWQPYIAATRQHIPEADERIVFDKYHVAAHLGAALDAVRRREQRELRGTEDRRLTGTRYLWLSNPETLLKRLKPEELERFDQLRRSTLRTARAYALKEAAMELWLERVRPKAEAIWKWWHAWAVRSRLEPMKKVARMLKRHLTGIINAIVTGVTNAGAESLNSKIQRVKRMACGFRNRDRFRTAIYFHLGGLDLSPVGITHSKS